MSELLVDIVASPGSTAVSVNAEKALAVIVENLLNIQSLSPCTLQSKCCLDMQHK